MQNVNAMPAVVVPANRRGLNGGLWAVQLLLAVFFLAAGATKLTAPVETLQQQMPWVTGSLGGAVRFIGLMEVLGAIGLILPAATRILPRLTPLAAGGLATVMLLATLTHISRGELGLIPVTGITAGLAAFVAWGRGTRVPIVPRA